MKRQREVGGASAALVPVSSPGAGPVAEQCVLEQQQKACFIVDLGCSLW